MKAYLKGAAVGGIAAAFVLVGTSALAGSGIGGIFHLGKTNTVNAKSTLKGSTTSKNLQITNTGNGAALGLKVKAGRPPLVVNSGVKVGKLNADKLDGRSSEHFQRAYARTVVVSPRSTAAREQQRTS